MVGKDLGFLVFKVFIVCGFFYKKEKYVIDINFGVFVKVLERNYVN